MTRSTDRDIRPLAALIAAAALTLALPITLAGCNTTEGAGEDLQELGKAIDDAAEDAKD